MAYDHFVIPFSIGVIVLLVNLFLRFRKWHKKLNSAQKSLMKRHFFSLRSLSATKEVFMESLLHRKIFRVSFQLGYMHASLAFGWFMLIVVGNAESRAYNLGDLNPPYYPIFFKFFVHDKTIIPFSQVFTFLMDFFLLIVLSGLVFAIVKRFRPKIVGMRQTTRLGTFDKLALASLWFIFPMRLLAESYAHVLHGSGGFLTGTVGNLLALAPYPETFFQIFWWLYSFSLGAFFISLPYSRYMHIPAEVGLIFARWWGIQSPNPENGFTDCQVQSCSRCGICVDKCQLQYAETFNSQAAYFLKSVRNEQTTAEIVNNCLLCGRCQHYCPVGIGIDELRFAKRNDLNPITASAFGYLAAAPNGSVNAKVAYFSGCMSQLTPQTMKAMYQIFRAAKIDFVHVDQDGSVCCGRPLMLSGQKSEAETLIKKNIELIKSSGAEVLVTNCPICYKVFAEDYSLDIPVKHHSVFISELLNKKLIEVNNLEISAIYHDPCDLGRGSGIYDQPRQVLAQIVSLQAIEQQAEKALCCGGSLANLELSEKQRLQIAQQAATELTAHKPDVLVTACPLCKNTFKQATATSVKDLAEITVDALVKN